MADSSRKAGRLFVVATPIGNLADITYRAVEILTTVDLIAAEDTRHSRKLLQKYTISTPLTAYHEHNEREQTKKLINLLIEGKEVALVSDAGTPLVSDPGYRLVCAAHERNITVTPIPGCCAAIAALSAAGLASDRFVFEGFLPHKKAARLNRLKQLQQESRTLIFYESAHRIEDSLNDAIAVFGRDRVSTLARELTKQHETLLRGTLDQIKQSLAADDNRRKGEFVLLVQGMEPDKQVNAETLRILGLLTAVLPPKQAADVTSKITGQPKNLIYQKGLEHKNK